MRKTSLDKSKIKFLLLEGVHPSALEVLRNAGYTQIESLPGALPEEQLKEKIAELKYLTTSLRFIDKANRSINRVKVPSIGLSLAIEYLSRAMVEIQQSVEFGNE